MKMPGAGVLGILFENQLIPGNRRLKLPGLVTPARVLKSDFQGTRQDHPCHKRLRRENRGRMKCNDD